MTEQEWFECSTLDPMWAFLTDSGDSNRIRLLFACACCRLIPSYMHSEPDRHLLEVIERDDLASEMLDQRTFAQAIPWYRRDGWLATILATEMYRDSVWYTRGLDDTGATEWQFGIYPRWEQALTPLLRDIVNPFHLEPVPTEWLTPDVLAVASVAYDERTLPSGHLDLSRLAVLSDALEEAGCTDDALLSHLRSPGPHIRGCWAIDLLLQRV